MRILLHDKGYKKMCELVDERDRHRCVICGSPYIQHHHVIFRSAGGSDTPENLVCLCSGCHSVYAHGKKSKSWQKILLDYLQDTKFDEFYSKNFRYIVKLIERYGKTEKVRRLGGESYGGRVDKNQ